MPQVTQLFQRNRLFRNEGPDGRSAQGDYMADRSQGFGDVPRQGAHIGSLAAGHLETGVILISHFDQGDRIDAHPAHGENRRLILARQIVGPPAIDLDRRIDRRALVDLAGKARQNRFDRDPVRAHGAGRRDLALGVVRVARLAPKHGEAVAFGGIHGIGNGLRRLAQGNRQDTRRQRIEAIGAEEESWRNRRADAARQQEQLTERGETTSADIERLAQQPAAIAAQRAELLNHVAAAEARRKEAADRLATGEAGQAEAGRALRLAEGTLAQAREDRVRCEAAVEQGEQAQTSIAERIAERLECKPDDILESAEIGADEKLPPVDELDGRLERLVRERDNMGPVNLRAEQEAEELGEQISTLGTEKNDLLEAISRLRHGIAELNREGRDRLIASFEAVNGHFQTLFTKLFGGGHAHLKLTDPDDPLEAGLEILASPPGKKMQNLSLLSGGERALTAVALLFAVFLTNPAPICVLDEVDAPLDDANVDRFCAMLADIAEQSATRFLLITHHRLTMARMDRLYGVTMPEPGVSQLVSVDLQAAEALQATA